MHFKIGGLFLAAVCAHAFAQNPIAGDSPYQIRAFSDLTVGESFINISNSGAAITATNHGTALSGNGTLCANVYVFNYAEEFVSCCSCPVTPNGLQSFRVNNDLIYSSLFSVWEVPAPGAIPTSVVVKSARDPLRGRLQCHYCADSRSRSGYGGVGHHAAPQHFGSGRHLWHLCVDRDVIHAGDRERGRTGSSCILVRSHSRR